jgi:dTDP-4-dehydrorhamnose reductase
MYKIIIYGSSGFLGKKLVKFLKKKNYRLIKDNETQKKKLKKTKNLFNFFLKQIKKNKPDVIINLVALTNVDECENDKKLAKKTNVFFTKELVQAINTYHKKIHLIHISTDQVYNGKGSHIEKTTQPINFYGYTKLQGEIFAQKTFSTILRTNFIGKAENKKKLSLSDWIVNSVVKNKKIDLFKNIFFSPLHTSTLVKLIEKVIKMKKKGIFNLSSKSKISKADFANRLCKELKLSLKNINKTNYNYKKLLAKRPLDMSLNVSKFEKYYNVKLPKVTNEIKKLVKEYSSEI